MATGIVHSHPPSHRAHLGSVPSRYMVASMSFIQTAVAGILKEELDDQEMALRASIAWNKLLMVQLDMLLAGYVTETPTEPENVLAGGLEDADPPAHFGHDEEGIND